MSSDLNMMSTQKGAVISPLVFDNSKVKGPLKLAQRVLVLFFKDRDTSSRGDLGTDVASFVKSSNVMNIGEFNNRCAISAASVSSAIMKEQYETLDIPDDEKLSALSVGVVSGATSDSMIINMNLTTVSGAALVLAVPA